MKDRRSGASAPVSTDSVKSAPSAATPSDRVGEAIREVSRLEADLEFLEDGRTIELISIGMVADDGREYYAVNRDMPVRKIRKHQWLARPLALHGVVAKTDGSVVDIVIGENDDDPVFRHGRVRPPR